MCQKIVSFFDNNKVLCKHHTAYVQIILPCIHPIIHLINKCADANNTVSKQHTLSIFCDLSKAFDVINPDILINKLNFYGIRGVVNKWFSS